MALPGPKSKCIALTGCSVYPPSPADQKAWSENLDSYGALQPRLGQGVKPAVLPIAEHSLWPHVTRHPEQWGGHAWSPAVEFSLQPCLTVVPIRWTWQDQRKLIKLLQLTHLTENSEWFSYRSSVNYTNTQLNEIKKNKQNSSGTQWEVQHRKRNHQKQSRSEKYNDWTKEFNRELQQQTWPTEGRIIVVKNR